MTDNSAVDTTEEQPQPVLPLLPRPRESRIIYVDTAGALADCVETLSHSKGWFAIDAERASGFKYGQRAYLIQIKREDSPIYLIDPVAISPAAVMADFARLAELLKTDRWILHAATQDLPCLNELGLKPSRLFDTELAGRLASLPRVGLGAMVERFLQVRLAKEHSAVDWSIRPLAEDWLNYAALDVDVLHELASAIEGELASQGKTEYAEQEFSHLLGFKPKAVKDDRWRGMTGMHEVKTQRALAIARELWTAREELAKRIDVSPGRLLPDASITQVAVDPPVTRSALADNKKFVGRASRTYLDTWWQALVKGAETKQLPPLKTPSTGIPNHRSWPQRFPDANGRLVALRGEITKLSESHAIPAENLMSPETIRQLSWQPQTEVTTESLSLRLAELGARAWQIAICASNFSEALKSLAEKSSSAENSDEAEVPQN